MTILSALTFSYCCSTALNADFVFSVASVTAFANAGTFLCTAGEIHPAENTTTQKVQARTEYLIREWVRIEDFLTTLLSSGRTGHSSHNKAIPRVDVLVFQEDLVNIVGISGAREHISNDLKNVFDPLSIIDVSIHNEFES